MTERPLNRQGCAAYARALQAGSGAVGPLYNRHVMWPRTQRTAQAIFNKTGKLQMSKINGGLPRRFYLQNRLAGCWWTDRTRSARVCGRPAGNHRAIATDPMPLLDAAHGRSMPGETHVSMQPHHPGDRGAVYNQKYQRQLRTVRSDRGAWDRKDSGRDWTRSQGAPQGGLVGPRISRLYVIAFPSFALRRSITRSAWRRSKRRAAVSLRRTRIYDRIGSSTCPDRPSNRLRGPGERKLPE